MSMKLEKCTPADEIRGALTALDSSKYEARGIDKLVLTGMSRVEDFRTMLLGLGMKEKEINEVLLWARPNKDGELDYNSLTKTIMEHEDPDEFLHGVRNDVARQKAVMRSVESFFTAVKPVLVSTMNHMPFTDLALFSGGCHGVRNRRWRQKMNETNETESLHECGVAGLVRWAEYIY